VAIVFARADGVAAWDRRLAMRDALDITVRRERGVVMRAGSRLGAGPGSER
jgi:hypothetical protein